MDGPPQQASAPRNPERRQPQSAASPSPQGAPTADHAAEAGLERLRALLLRPEAERLETIQQRIEDPELRRDQVADALPEAIRRAAAKDQALAASLAPLVAKGLAQSVRRDPSLIIEVIFPVLGPAIRRAVAQALRGAVESLNRVVEHSFTWRGLRWRMEAWRTGRTVADIALSRSLVYRVEQVFLIHRETGLPLMVVGADEERRDPDLISGMLTAIQDFVHDSFAVSGDQNLDRLEIGDFQVWIERGPRAVVAGVIRGSAPRRVRTLLAETIGDIHAQLREPLETFDGDATMLEPARPFLEACLEQEYVRPRRRKGLQPSAIVALVVVGVLLFGWAWLSWRDSQRWADYLAALDAEPGLTALDQGSSWGVRRALVLRDPLAAEPLSLLAANGLDPDDVELRTQSIVSTDPEIAVRRARATLDAPESVAMAMSDGVLRLSGEAPAAWIRQALPSASFLPGVAAVDSDALGDTDRRALDRAVEQAESWRVSFPIGEATLDASAQASISDLAETLSGLLRRAVSLQAPVRIRLLGGADPRGTPQLNARLRRRRAEAVRRTLVASGIPSAPLEVQAGDSNSGASSLETRTVAVKIVLGAPPASANELP